MYKINEETVALIQNKTGYFNTKIIQGKRDFPSKHTAEKILEYSCDQYGSSYLGRMDYAKSILKNNTKLPIPVFPEKGVFFFPTTSPRNAACVWISYYHIKDYKRNGSFTRVYFYNGIVKIINVSFYQFDSQMNRMSRVIAQYHFPFLQFKKGEAEE